MSGFVATASVPQEPQAEGVLVNDGWFPDIDLAAVRDSVRMDGTVTPTRLRDSVLYAMSAVNDQLRAYQATQAAAGHDSLGAVSSATIGGQRRLVMLYRRAVYATASADLMERYRSFDSSGAGERRAEDNDPAIGEQMRNARWAVRDIQGEPHCTVELI